MNNTWNTWKYSTSCLLSFTHHIFVFAHACYLLGIMSNDLPLQLLGGAKLEGHLKEGQPGINDIMSEVAQILLTNSDKRMNLCCGFMCCLFGACACVRTWRQRPVHQWVWRRYSSAAGWGTGQEWALCLSPPSGRLLLRCSERNSGAAAQTHQFDWLFVALNLQH